MIRHYFHILAAFALGSCATFPPPEPRQPLADQDLLAQDDPETTAEWLFITAEDDAIKTSKCEQVATWLEGEKACKGEICLHARDLGRDWLQRCPKEAPERVGSIKKLVTQYEDQANQPIDACIRQGTTLLRTQECGEPSVCEEQAQGWIARCGTSYATPLFVLMLTRTLQRRFPDDPNLPVHKVEFDPRSCDALAEAVGEGIGCDGMEACKPAVKAGEAWMGRCYEKNLKVPLLLAFRLVDVRVGGGHGVDPIPANPLEPRLEDGSFPLLLSDNRGVVTWVCGTRPKTLDEYIKTRRECERGEVIVARLDASRSVRTVSVPHANDETYGRLFPFLEVKGERDARDLAHVEGFREILAEAVDAAQGPRPERAIRLMVEGFRKRDGTISRQVAYQKILTNAEGALTPAFREWGRLKVKSAPRVRGGEEQALFAGRALQNPLHDMSMDGSVSAGAYLAPRTFAIDRWMPLSFLEYREAVEPLERTAFRHQPSDARINQVRSEVHSEIRACSQAEARIQAVQEEVMACMFVEGGCTQAKIAELAAKADPDRERARRSRERILRNLSAGLLSRADADRLDAERVSSGCLDP